MKKKAVIINVGPSKVVFVRKVSKGGGRYGEQRVIQIPSVICDKFGIGELVRVTVEKIGDVKVPDGYFDEVNMEAYELKSVS